MKLHQLRGLYSPPSVKSATLHDEYQGDVKVAGMTDAPILWPAFIYNRGLHTGLLPVLTGDLVRAICEIAVAAMWGVTLHIVNQWKCAIAKSADSNEVAVNLALLCRDPAFRRKYYR